MNPENDRIRDLLGVTAWHKAGYTGKNGLTFTGESDDTQFEHGGMTREAHLEIAPDRKIVCPTPSRTYATDKVDVSVVYEQAKNLNADTMYQSYIGENCGWDDLVAPEEFFIIASSGNDGTGAYNKRIEAEQIYGCSAVTYMASGSIVPAYYSSDSKFNDFCAPANLWLWHGVRSGTSYASPVLAGIVALVNDFFIDKTGKPLKRKIMYEFLKAYSMDIGTNGKDIDTGWGMPVLPPPETIDIWRWQDKPVKASEILKLAQSQIGVKENPANSNNVKYNTEYYGREINDSAYAWCAVFIWWLFKQIGASGLYYGGGKTASCTTLNSYHKARGQSVTDYKPGDIIFFDFSGNKKITEHVGICESVEDGYITTIDGNTGTTNEANGGAVMRRKRALKYVSAAYRPEYEKEEDEDEMTIEQFKEMYNEVNPLYTSLSQVPSYWQEETKALIQEGAIQGDGTHELNIRNDALQSAIICKRYADKK